jgi:ubiquitin-protein ligase
MATAHATHPAALRRRLLYDIADIQEDPYPNIHLHVNDADVMNACLILSPPQGRPLHLTISFTNRYPLTAPSVTIQTKVHHPNVYGTYICASILNTSKDWTPAYTLKGILIQLLSFFSSDSLEQAHGKKTVVDLSKYRQKWGHVNGELQYMCTVCGFDEFWVPPTSDRKMWDTRASMGLVVGNGQIRARRSRLFEMPDEMVLSFMSYMDVADIIAFADAVPSIKHLLNSYDFIRIRELQCFCLKKSFLNTKLGIGVSITSGNRPVFRSEFNLLSNEAYNCFKIRRSIQGVEFKHWLPLPLSRRHWASVRRNANLALEKLHSMAKLGGRNKVEVLYHFMNTIVVQFSIDVNRSYREIDARSTLTHASEKAVESYFGLFHLLLCIATEDPTIITSANLKVQQFLRGPRHKDSFPNLGHLLVAALISDDGLTQDVAFHIIKEAVVRNVVWMLDVKGAGMAELAYLEPSGTSEYRLAKTFEASRTSYRLLMFLRLFSCTARKPGKSLVQLRDELFDTHGAPPAGTATKMADLTRNIHQIDGFPDFLKAMGINAIPTKSQFSAYLKRTIEESIEMGYSCMPYNQTQLFMIRKAHEPGVEAVDEVEVTETMELWYSCREKSLIEGYVGQPSFFPTRLGRSGMSGRREKR